MRLGLTAAARRDHVGEVEVLNEVATGSQIEIIGIERRTEREIDIEIVIEREIETVTTTAAGTGTESGRETGATEMVAKRENEKEAETATEGVIEVHEDEAAAGNVNGDNHLHCRHFLRILILLVCCERLNVWLCMNHHRHLCTSSEQHQFL